MTGKWGKSLVGGKKTTRVKLLVGLKFSGQVSYFSPENPATIGISSPSVGLPLSCVP
jgi:hypothetical protein